MNALPDPTDSPTRNRTRAAILGAAFHVLGENPAAALGEVADAAQVARSTLHRYFPERSDLIAAMNRFAEEEIAAAAVRARLDEGRADEALVRLALEYFDQWDAIVWSYMQSQASSRADDAISEQTDPTVSALVARGQADGTIDHAMSNTWFQNLLWAILYTAWEYVKQGATRHEAMGQVMHTLRKVLEPATGRTV